MEELSSLFTQMQEVCRHLFSSRELVETLSRPELMKGFAALADAMVFRITSSELSREAKEDLLKDLASIPIVIADTARKQTRFRRGKNGPAEEAQGKLAVYHERSDR